MKHYSIWLDKARKQKDYPSLQGEGKCEVAVIGGGITGLSTAYNLSQQGKNVTVLEASKIGNGSTGLSSCHLNTDIDTKYKNLYTDFDTEIIELVAESRVAGIQTIEDNIRREGIKCGFKRIPGFYYTDIQEHAQDIEEEYEHLKKTILDVSIKENAPLPFETYKAIKHENQAWFNAQEYLHGLAEAIDKSGSKIYEHSRVIHIEEKDDYFIITTEEGKLKAEKLVLATHLPIFFNVLQTVSAPYRSYVVAARVEKGSIPEGLFWDTAEPYHYIRSCHSESHDYLIVGGEDHKTGHLENAHEQYAKLEHYVKSHFKVEEIEYKWSAQYYEPADGLPYIGKSPFSKKTFVATGFSGDGLVYGTIAARIIADLIAGKDNKWLYAYDASRFTPAASAYDFIRENADAAKHFIADRVDNDETTAELYSGEGKILEIDGEKLAVSRDESGELNAVSPVCTHLKCIVNWNKAEKSWDCPCHGSRFDGKGEIICGPAVKNLEKKKIPAEKLQNQFKK
ncbi:FAD-dependent oxidoreductase [Cytophagaceae bacterium ABcell3]|nr:FAD-dependent oxidoreductase [Cytophagaceae bacterium ABcell3]